MGLGSGGHAMIGNKRTGWIVYNGGLRLEKFTEQLDWLGQTLQDFGIKVIQIGNHELTACVRKGDPALLYGGPDHGILPVWMPDSLPKPDFVLFWDKDVRLASLMERVGFRLFNSSSAIAACDDKGMTHQLLSGHGILMPDTLIAPFFYPGFAPEPDDFTTLSEKELGYPVVVKESYGSFGAQVHLAKDRRELDALHGQMRFVPHLCQRFIAASFGRDVRLQVVGTRVVAAMLRRSNTDFRANISAGGHMEPFDPPDAFRKMAVDATGILRADFAGVDILFGADGEPVLCEVNSNAHMRNIYQCTGVNVPYEIAKYLTNQLIG